MRADVGKVYEGHFVCKVVIECELDVRSPRGRWKCCTS